MKMRKFKAITAGVMFLLGISAAYLWTGKIYVNAEGNTDSSSDTITKEGWDAFEPEITDPPKSIKATKSKTLETNVPEGVDISFAVSDGKIASVNDKGVFKGKRVGKVTVTATFTATVEGKEQTKDTTCNIKIAGKKKVYIDAGHQSRANNGLEPVGPGSSSKKLKVSGGCVGVATGIPEYKFTLTMAKKLKKALLAEGYDVAMSRTKNEVNITNVERAKKGNKSGADICIRIHSDSINNSSTRGVSVLYPSTSNPYPIKKQAKKSKKLAKALLEEYCDATGISSRGIVVRNDLSGTNWSTIPTALIECGFFSNPTEDRLLNDPDMQKKMVKGMVAGIDRYFGY